MALPRLTPAEAVLTLDTSQRAILLEDVSSSVTAAQDCNALER